MHFQSLLYDFCLLLTPLFSWIFASTAVKVSSKTVALLDKEYTNFAIQQLKDVAGCGSTLALQPITKAHLQAAKDAGGDAIDLDPSMGTFICKRRPLIIEPSYFDG